MTKAYAPFQLTAARRRLGQPACRLNRAFPFQLTAARRRLEPYFIYVGGAEIFQLTAARRRLALPNRYHKQSASISTHSRAKAAGQFTITGLCCLPDFNSQPREGGWLVRPCMRLRLRISTHSRAKAAGFRIIIFVRPFQFQLTAARRRLGDSFRQLAKLTEISTHSRAKAAG